jgi:general stress protein 26
MAVQRSRRGSLAAVWSAVGDYEHAVAITWSAARRPHAVTRTRPIVLEDPEELGGGEPWFVTSRAAESGGGISSGQPVGVCCFGDEDGGWLSLSTVARIDDDRLAIHRLWNPEWRTRLPGGPDDPDLILVRLRVVRAEQWQPVPGCLRVIYEEPAAAPPTAPPTGPTEPAPPHSVHRAPA